MNVLVVAAHPDDEVLGCGGTLARHAASGDRTHCLILAEGATSRSPGREVGAHADELEALRASAQAAAAALGTSSVRFGGLPDNRLDSVDLLDVIKLVETALAATKADVVYTHHAGDLNVDHRVAHAATVTAARPVPGQRVSEILTFETVSSTEWGTSLAPLFVPTTFVDIADTWPSKVAALACYTTEMRPSPHPRSLETIEALATLRGSTAGLTMAEAFVVVRQVR